ncbi:uncharacterized protein EAF01_010120 [Botrytis porri]|uniref:Uncharacterized protein n=1 Tax=Botrytis porri TaxID=87229 RepID=A0A4Z1L267_9HELO|nr:uncharacterized protein EAF01_010120 [Botrytis porri]KAF7894670.1 hypothetical protein EAF01_010120 [Botrytis porri]TGO90880.1 hypothetical protein BPOR_0047g00030 [Botrytis porri]
MVTKIKQDLEMIRSLNETEAALIFSNYIQDTISITFINLLIVEGNYMSQYGVFKYNAPDPFRWLDSVSVGEGQKKTIYKPKNENNEVEFVLFENYLGISSNYEKGLYGWVCYPVAGEWKEFKKTNLKGHEERGALVANLTQVWSHALRSPEIEVKEKWECRTWSRKITEWMVDWAENVDSWYPGEEKLAYLAKCWQPIENENWNVVTGRELRGACDSKKDQ